MSQSDALPPEAIEPYLAHGRRLAQDLLHPPELNVKAALHEEPKGTLIAEGDSWFDYPGADVVRCLREMNWDVRSVARFGHDVEAMAFEAWQLEGLRRECERLARSSGLGIDGPGDSDVRPGPTAFLISGGGNDIAGPEFAMLLEHARSPGGARAATEVMDHVLGVRIRNAVLSLTGSIQEFSQRYFRRDDIPIFIHGYGNARPTGRAFKGIGLLPGPWLAPAFERKGLDRDRDIEAMTLIVSQVIGHYNAVLAQLARSVPVLHYVDVRPVLANSADDYRSDWQDEMHPSAAAFSRIAELLDSSIDSVVR
ncbi:MULTISPECIES: hypothetical protein [Gordonia]|uniref:SGNH hydrolase-type esterase domain-containing protein n=1 Tax=Gordonia tangerina TaxID=2911060 RepID=A0ABS9DEF3_9ACTN|nr:MULTISPECIES: hypothetical protein [Gordonia]MAU82913.1 hypothetical protein [Gordonia sp. (in: high G+C Gram-positive bacteria)]MCF3937600.1 hypothetical protein [Gordonia tangerina]